MFSLTLTLHLDQEFCLDAPCCLALILIPRATQRVHLIDEDDGGLVLACQVKEVLNEPEGDKEGGMIFTKLIISIKNCHCHCHFL